MGLYAVSEQKLAHPNRVLSLNQKYLRVGVLPHISTLLTTTHQKMGVYSWKMTSFLLVRLFRAERLGFVLSSFSWGGGKLQLVNWDQTCQLGPGSNFKKLTRTVAQLLIRIPPSGEQHVFVCSPESLGYQVQTSETPQITMDVVPVAHRHAAPPLAGKTPCSNARRCPSLSRQFLFFFSYLGCDAR